MTTKPKRVSERHIELIISEYPHIIFPGRGYKLVGRQVMIGNLVADVLFTKGKSQLIVVEVKKGNLERGVGEQVLGYRLALKAIEPNKRVKCVVVANYAKPEFRKVLENWRIEVIELDEEYLKRLLEKHGDQEKTHADLSVHCIYHQDKKMLLEYASTDMKLKCCLASCDYKLPYTPHPFDLSIADADIDSYLKHLKINRKDSRIIQLLPCFARVASLASCSRRTACDRDRENTDKSHRETELDQVKQNVKRCNDIITVLEPIATKAHLCLAYEALADLYYQKIYDLEDMFYIADFDKNLLLLHLKAAEHLKKAIDLGTRNEEIYLRLGSWIQRFGVSRYEDEQVEYTDDFLLQKFNARTSKYERYPENEISLNAFYDYFKNIAFTPLGLFKKAYEINNNSIDTNYKLGLVEADLNRLIYHLSKALGLALKEFKSYKKIRGECFDYFNLYRCLYALSSAHFERKEFDSSSKYFKELVSFIDKKGFEGFIASDGFEQGEGWKHRHVLGLHTPGPPRMNLIEELRAKLKPPS